MEKAGYDTQDRLLGDIKNFYFFAHRQGLCAHTHTESDLMVLPKNGFVASATLWSCVIMSYSVLFPSTDSTGKQMANFWSPVQGNKV